MNKVIGMFHINQTDYQVFGDELIKTLKILQDDNQEPEVQYSVNTLPNGQLVYSALVLGRKIVTFGNSMDKQYSEV